KGRVEDAANRLQEVRDESLDVQCVDVSGGVRDPEIRRYAIVEIDVRREKEAENAADRREKRARRRRSGAAVDAGQLIDVVEITARVERHPPGFENSGFEGRARTLATCKLHDRSGQRR